MVGLIAFKIVKYNKKTSMNEGFYGGCTPDTIRTCGPQLSSKLFHLKVNYFYKQKYLYEKFIPTFIPTFLV